MGLAIISTGEAFSIGISVAFGVLHDLPDYQPLQPPPPRLSFLPFKLHEHQDSPTLALHIFSQEECVSFLTWLTLILQDPAQIVSPTEVFSDHHLS